MVNMNGPVKMASYDMAGKTAVVTGGTKGIGKAIALAFGQCGANVVVAGRHEDECTAVAEAITSAGGHGKGIRTDVRNIDEIDALIAGAAETFGGVDILINCAGVAITKKILDLDVEDYDMVMETNLRSVLFASKAAAAVMKASEKNRVPDTAQDCPILRIGVMHEQPVSERENLSKWELFYFFHSLSLHHKTTVISI